MDIGRGDEQSYIEVPAGQVQSVIFISLNYILMFQAGLLVHTKDFKEFEEDGEPQPLGMEHVYFPLGLWLAGLLLSSFFLLVEIIIKYRGNR